jgi:hypothetical protein
VRDRVLEEGRVAESMTARLERERLDVDRSILELSAELAGIRRELAGDLEHLPASPAAGEKKLTAAERLRMKVDQRAAQLAVEREPGRPTLEDIGRQQLEQEKRHLEEEKRQSFERQRDNGLELD